MMKKSMASMMMLSLVRSTFVAVTFFFASCFVCISLHILDASAGDRNTHEIMCMCESVIGRHFSIEIEPVQGRTFRATTTNMLATETNLRKTKKTVHSIMINCCCSKSFESARLRSGANRPAKAAPAFQPKRTWFTIEFEGLSMLLRVDRLAHWLVRSYTNTHFENCFFFCFVFSAAITRSLQRESSACCCTALVPLPLFLLFSVQPSRFAVFAKYTFGGQTNTATCLPFTFGLTRLRAGSFTACDRQPRSKPRAFATIVPSPPQAVLVNGCRPHSFRFIHFFFFRLKITSSVDLLFLFSFALHFTWPPNSPHSIISTHPLITFHLCNSLS